jgi:hypothetical protein
MTRFSMLLTAAAALASTAALAQSPQALCVAAPAQIEQAAAAKAGTAEARKALYNSATAVKLCNAGAAKEAQKKFKIAFKALDLDYAAALAQAGSQAN